MEHSKERIKLQGETCWTDLYSDNADATIKFLSDNLGIEVVNGSKEDVGNYKIIKTKEGAVPHAAVSQLDELHKEKGVVPHSVPYFAVKNYDEMHKKFMESGAKSIVDNVLKQDMNLKYGIYIIPDGLDIGIVEFNPKS